MMRQLWRELWCAHEWSAWTDAIPLSWPTFTAVPPPYRMFSQCWRCQRVRAVSFAKEGA